MCVDTATQKPPWGKEVICRYVMFVMADATVSYKNQLGIVI